MIGGGVNRASVSLFSSHTSTPECVCVRVHLCLCLLVSVPAADGFFWGFFLFCIYTDQPGPDHGASEQRTHANEAARRGRALFPRVCCCFSPLKGQIGEKSAGTFPAGRLVGGNIMFRSLLRSLRKTDETQNVTSE